VNKSELIHQIKSIGSFLCVGLDSDINKIPKHLLQEENPILAFNKQIIDATKNYCVAYKINTAFYEAMGYSGWKTMEETLAYIPKNKLTIADAKRGDIGNTSNMYAKAFFETIPFDAITLAPYMGKDSLSPFFEYQNKWGIILALTSNPGSADFEQQTVNHQKLFEHVIETFSQVGTSENTMFVVGATKPEELGKIRKMVPDYFFLVPGVGAQGGSLSDVCNYGLNNEIGLLINASRSIIYASSSDDFAEKAAIESAAMANEMKEILKVKGII
jgi:orotidine-5'-phosphate decarboxylase